MGWAMVASWLRADINFMASTSVRLYHPIKRGRPMKRCPCEDNYIPIFLGINE